MGKSTRNDKQKKAVKRTVDDLEGNNLKKAAVCEPPSTRSRSGKGRPSQFYRKLNEGLIDPMGEVIPKENKVGKYEKGKMNAGKEGSNDTRLVVRTEPKIWSNVNSNAIRTAVGKIAVQDMDANDHSESHLPVDDHLNEFINSFNDGIQVTVDTSDLEAFDEQEAQKEQERVKRRKTCETVTCSDPVQEVAVDSVVTPVMQEEKQAQ